jgi:murein DD-endopeptidase MepM/ murein hydrolase activator NlpD
VERIRLVDPGTGYGKYVRIAHANGFKTWYCHLASISVILGEVINVGDILGLAGTTGNSTGVHLHLNLQWIDNGLEGYVIPDIVDPTPYLVDEVTPL